MDLKYPTNYYSNPYTPKEGYQTKLDSPDERMFLDWVKKNNVPFKDSPDTDYDMRGFFKGLLGGDSRAFQGINNSDNQMHFSDYWKTPYHPTFSHESKFATNSAPKWKEDVMGWKLDDNGKTVFREQIPQSNYWNDLNQKLDKFFQESPNDTVRELNPLFNFNAPAPTYVKNNFKGVFK